MSLLFRLALRHPRDIMVTSGDLVESDLGDASAYAGLMWLADAMRVLAVLLDAIETREDQPSKDRLALTPVVGECEELDRVTVRGCVSLRVCGASGCAAFGCCTALNCFRAFALRIQALTAFGGFSRLVGCFCLFPLSAHVEQLRVFLFWRPVLLSVAEYLLCPCRCRAWRLGGACL